MMVLEFGWGKKYIVKSEDALKIIQILEKAELYSEEWRKAEDGGTMYHVWPMDSSEDLPSLRLVSDALYQMAKLAGKPVKGA
jgi:hypothetical protein